MTRETDEELRRRITLPIAVIAALMRPGAPTADIVRTLGIVCKDMIERTRDDTR